MSGERLRNFIGGEYVDAKDGRTLERYTQPQRSDGKIVGMVINFRDITERKRAEADLEMVNRQLLVTTRQAGMVVLTDLTPTVLGWRGQPRPTGLPGSQITHAGRGALESAVRGLIGQDTTSQVWMSTSGVAIIPNAAAGHQREQRQL